MTSLGLAAITSDARRASPMSGVFASWGLAMLEIPLRNARHEVVGHAIVDDEDASIAALRWCLNGNGYAWRSDGQNSRPRQVYLHRVLMGMRPGDGLYVDHINHDRLDNRRANLRVVTPAESRQNTPAIGGSSKHRGVSFDQTRQKWTAHAQLDGKMRHIGRYATEAEAAEAARVWRLANMPFTVEIEGRQP